MGLVAENKRKREKYKKASAQHVEKHNASPIETRTPRDRGKSQQQANSEFPKSAGNLKKAENRVSARQYGRSPKR
jgi:hypothetical protein